MTRLSAVDALFLAVETREMPAHVAGLQVFRLPDGKDSAWLQEMMAELREHPPGPPFDQRVHTSLTGLPELVEDEDFEIDYHLRHTVLPSPGNEEQLYRVLTRMHANLLDRDRPLWEFHLIEGLEDRNFAFYIKIHHAICDGATFSMWMSQSTERSPDDATRPIWERPRGRSGNRERPWLAALQAPASLLRKTGDVTLGLGKLAGKIINQRFLEGDDRLALPLSGPHTALNMRLTASRNLAFTHFPVDVLKAIGRPWGATLNDVVLAICDAALRRYLAEQGQVFEKPLVAMVPVNLRKPGEQSEGNFVTALQVKLGDPDQDPVARLQSIVKTMKTAKELYSDVPTAASQFYSFGTGLLAAAGASLHLEGIMPPPLNLIISNVPGPREPRYFNGAQLVATYPISGIAPMTALNVTVYSYNGELFFGLISGRRAMPHLSDLKLCLEEVFEEFRKACL